MGQVLHGSATTTHATRAALRRSQASVTRPAGRYGLNELESSAFERPGGGASARASTTRRWGRSSRARGADAVRRSRLRRLSPPHAAAVRRWPSCPAQATIPRLARSSLHRRLRRHAVSRPPETGGDKPRCSRFKRYPIDLEGAAFGSRRSCRGPHREPHALRVHHRMLDRRAPTLQAQPGPQHRGTQHLVHHLPSQRRDGSACGSSSARTNPTLAHHDL